MLLTLEKSSSHDDIESLISSLRKLGLHPHLSESEGNPVVGIEKNLTEEVKEKLTACSPITKITEITVPYKMASRQMKEEPTIVSVGDVKIGEGHVTLIAGPCAIESEEQLIKTAEGLKKSGVKILRASAFKPRSSPYSFQGMGIEGLMMHKRAKQKHGLLIETEVMDPRDVLTAAEYVDILRVGARNMQNFDLLKELGRCNKPVILKRGMSSTIEEWLLSAEYIMAHGNPNVILCERGIRTFETATRSTLDLSAIAVVKRLTHLPVIVDPSHAAGRSDIIPALSRAAIAVGADGLLIEVHHKPRESLCDEGQALSLDEFEEIANETETLAKVLGKIYRGR
ncbi:MAG: 3-deoxy-7-phosphoheptulonate synthase [Chlamydiia bacterium]|nr:3-deoxy-7-phosphoheptulonate synthase [Chlamydiia bacterium]